MTMSPLLLQIIFSGITNFRKISLEKAFFVDSAMKYLSTSYKIYQKNENLQGMAFYYEGIAEIKFALRELDSAFILISTRRLV